MKNILILGAGLSTNILIDYLLKNSVEYNWHVTIADINEDLAKQKLNGHSNGKALAFNIEDDELTVKAIADNDIVISMLPAFMHKKIALKCIDMRKPMLTASYASDDIKELNDKAKKAGIPLYMELGLDPGIDHMSAMNVINKIKDDGNELTSFYSFTGGLVAPDSDNNPWNYKFTWNPRNVVMAGNGVSQFIKNGRYKYIPYHRLFDRAFNRKILGYGDFEVYANRDSLKYRSIYDLKDIPSMFRGTIRRPGFSKAWNVFVRLGMTEDNYTLESSENMTYRQFLNSFLRYEPNVPAEIKLQEYCSNAADPVVMEKLKWLGIFDERKIGLKNATPAQILQQLLEERWSMDPQDKDMIVMQHEFKYLTDGVEKMIVSAMAVIGKNQTETAMAITVGLPLAIATKLLMLGKFNHTGVILPTEKQMYEPILDELSTFGITFEENEYLIG
ncbi:MAG: saccharopine dehydrogenase [Lentimicrobiaceae bacterium]|jgi:saccharopine dehydrogenase-like NADP-dependent oxidoreductase|nr:saccharopine dehydrogenase [Lentimicrobiaceae bacterium]MBT3454466.1 saccharopine dehydrogenase [Lentimicrobiaceae bacterium]MBT3818076.1 saccharopine dehydrogenase [Lentimicrobiaceae bacterium]MBT4190674.1 saccharopine dehydrogenase [Lentimicrobiaceae bacterium]MBT4466840.1 saccharopine dehydrogenase [Lentimicrobiaceae bacterium]